VIAQKVENNWLRPVSTSNDQSCEVIVTQTMMGDVIEVFLQACTSDVAFQRSVNVRFARRRHCRCRLTPNCLIAEYILNLNRDRKSGFHYRF